MQFAVTKEKSVSILNMFHSFIKDNSNTQKQEFDSKLHSLVSENGYSNKEAFMSLRVAITGSKTTPPISDIIFTIGIPETLSRIQDAIFYLK